MELAKYKACICEGSAENAIIDILLDYELLIFSREEMIEEEVIRCREGKKFEEKYLRKGFEDKYKKFKKSGKKPSSFCKEDLKMADVKSYDFVKDYFSDPMTLVAAIKKYHEMSKVQKAEYTLLDLLR